MLRRIPRPLRAALLGALLALSAAACEIDVRMVTRVEADGSGRFSLRFLIDRELVELAANLGEDPFSALECPAALAAAGWRCDRSTERGGIAISLERPFSSPEELRSEMERLERLAADRGAPTARFFTLRVTREGGFLRSRTAVAGSIDLTTEGVLGEASEADRQLLDAIAQQSAGEFFRFELRVELPGAISGTTGDPSSVRGGVAIWSPRLGQRLAFGASSEATRAGPVALVAGPPVALALALGWALLRRGRRQRTGSIPISRSSARTRRAMSSRISRTLGSGAPAGSSTGQS